MTHRTDYSLLPHNTFGIDVRCRHFVQYDTPEELREFLTLSPSHSSLLTPPLLHIGGGSNLLFLRDFDGTVLHSNIRTIDLVSQDADSVLLRVGAAVVWDDLVAYALGQGWYGLENLSLIPGEVGASAVQNIGAYGAEAKDYIQEVECMSLETGEVRTFTNAECQYGYRHSVFKTDGHRGRWAVLHVTYRLSTRFVPRLGYGGLDTELLRRGVIAEMLTGQLLREVIIDIRRRKLPDPKEQGNAGSFFMNPVVERCAYEALSADYPSVPHYDVDAGHVKIPAAWLIEQSGWKGRALGPAAVHDRQPLVLVNRGGATGADVLRLCEAVRSAVRRQFSVDLQPEVNLIG